jgi:hypothetical protein
VILAPNPERVVSLAQEGLKLLGDDPGCRETRSMNEYLSRAYCLRDQYEKAREHAFILMDSPGESDWNDYQARIYTCVQWLLWNKKPVEAALLIDRMEKRARQHHSLQYVEDALEARTSHVLCRGNLHEGVNLFRRKQLCALRPSFGTISASLWTKTGSGTMYSTPALTSWPARSSSLPRTAGASST